MRPVRDPAVAGTFYPDDPAELTQVVDGLLGQASC
jgi:AmmeMemoRadiSam system protein B